MPIESAERLVPPDESDEIDRAQRGDDAAVRAIMRRHNRRLYRLARSVLRDDAEAEDVVQESYFRAFTHLAEFRRESGLGTWLARIVLNEALGRQRRRRPTVALADEDDRGHTGATVIAFPSHDPDPERTMAQHEILHLLEQAIDGLPDDFRVILVARVIEEMSVEQTADLFGLRPETVKTRLHRARRMLREALEQRTGPMLTDTFPFAGARCEQLADAVIQRIARSR